MSSRNIPERNEGALASYETPEQNLAAQSLAPRILADAAQFAKRKVIDDLEIFRGAAHEPSCAAYASSSGNTPAPERQAPELPSRPIAAVPAGGAAAAFDADEITALRRELEKTRSMSSLFQEELVRLEKKALDAIAEAGELRRRLDSLAESREATANTDARAPSLQTDRKELERGLELAEDQGRLLTRALNESEMEIFRLAKSIDLLVRKIDAA